jgi:hypothetical protein
MNKIRQLKKTIIETAPSFYKYDENNTPTSNMLNSRTKLGFSKLFYSYFHAEGATKMFDRRYKTPIIQKTRLFGPRAEVLYLIAISIGACILTRNNLQRERIDENFKDRNVFYISNVKTKIV